ncbi:hypothetical protein [Nocardiopsis ansamitocini]|uniref:Uncharacterized protein n=1 Tax=Nocardiopsis ansamitocini TaxID=1670832 RepID=A0A9W6P3W2_9ACTN|nr:hypothetical protein [Nocardiopsis ansamitocini]GLU46825.1 hypothetical protein Nans01_11760 [Nocardiopsis ansamitocini]
MSKPTLVTKITDALKRAFGGSSQPVASSKPEDAAAPGAVTPDTAPSGAVPADAAPSEAAGEFTTEAASSEGQRPAAESPAASTEPVSPAAPVAEPVGSAQPAPSPVEESAQTAPAEDAEDTASPAETVAEETSALVQPEEKAEIVEALDVAEAPTGASDTAVFSAVHAAAAEGARISEGDIPLPVPNYEALTLPSVRARLRKLTLEEVRQLRTYESTNDNRAEFVRMYDNRIAKLEAEAQA